MVEMAPSPPDFNTRRELARSLHAQKEPLAIKPGAEQIPHLPRVIPVKLSEACVVVDTTLLGY